MVRYAQLDGDKIVNIIALTDGNATDFGGYTLKKLDPGDRAAVGGRFRNGNFEDPPAVVTPRALAMQELAGAVSILDLKAALIKVLNEYERILAINDE